MFYGEGLLKGMLITLKHFFGHAITQEYPEETPRFADRYRGFFDWSEINCTACKACQRACPNEVITIDSQRHEKTKKRVVESFKMYLEYCLFCGLCVEACPYNALHFTPEHELAGYYRNDTIYEMVSTPETVSAPSADLMEDHTHHQAANS